MAQVAQFFRWPSSDTDGNITGELLYNSLKLQNSLQGRVEFSDSLSFGMS